MRWMRSSSGRVWDIWCAIGSLVGKISRRLRRRTMRRAGALLVASWDRLRFCSSGPRVNSPSINVQKAILTVTGLCEALEDLSADEKHTELLPISVQRVYVLTRLGRLEEAEQLASTIRPQEYVSRTITSAAFFYHSI